MVRTEPDQTIAVVGTFGDDDEPALAALGGQVTDTLHRLRPVTYRDVEDACGVLADKLTDHLGNDGISTCRLIGLPRGGVIVAGLLSYALGISRDQLEGPVPPGAATVVVDDCMLSGARMRRWLRSTNATDVVIATLHAPADLRRAVEQDPAVKRCLAAVDLSDHAPRQQGAGYAAWRQRWADRSPDDFWTGHADHVCYPWNEPDTLIWNDGADRAEPGWRVIPPNWCLKNRRENPAAAADVQVCIAPQALTVSPSVLWADMDDAVIVLDAEQGDSVLLTDVTADFWRALVTEPDLQGAIVALQTTYDVDPERLRADVEHFVHALRTKGIAVAAE